MSVWQNLYTGLYRYQQGSVKGAGSIYPETKSSKIAVNTSKLSRYLWWTIQELYDQLYEALEESDREKLCSAYPLAARWIEARTEEELSPLSHRLCACHEYLWRGIFPKVITPGVPPRPKWRNGLHGRSIVSDWPSGSALMWISSERESPGCFCRDIIQHGDLLHYDVGITYFGLCPGQPAPGICVKRGMKQKFRIICGRGGLEVTNRFQDIVAQEHIAGRTGNEIPEIQPGTGKTEGIRARRNIVIQSVLWPQCRHSSRSVGQTGRYRYLWRFPLCTTIPCYALELNTESTVAGGTISWFAFCAEETVAFTEDGKFVICIRAEKKSLQFNLDIMHNPFYNNGKVQFSALEW